MHRINVFDSYPGSGKTSYLLEKINKLPDHKRVIFITPFLNEVERVKSACSGKRFITPDRRLGKGRKRNHLMQLILEGRNIVSTHSLFSNIDDELMDALAGGNYILVLDEVMDVLDKFDMWEEIPGLDEDARDVKTKKEIEFLANQGIVRVDEYTGMIYWLDESAQPGKYEKIRNLALRELLFLINGEVIVWTFPIDVFKEGIFEEIYILTYQFDWQIQASYYKYFGLEYETYHIEKINDKYIAVKTNGDGFDKEWKLRVKKKIHILDNPRLNRIGDVSKFKSGSGVPLTKNWYDTKVDSIPIVARNAETFFKHIANTKKSSERMWTCFVRNKSSLSSSYLPKKNWLPLNSRATNVYGEKTAAAYLIDRWLNPFIVNFFSKKGVIIDQDKFAVSELIQWIWRSAIRNDKDVEVFIPSERMRTLLIKFLNDEPVEFKAISYYKD